jgi:acetyl esterase/lipase
MEALFSLAPKRDSRLNRFRLVPFKQSQLLVAALEAAGAPVKFHPVEGGGHGEYFGAGGGCGLYADPAVAPMVKAFFATHLAAK